MPKSMVRPELFMCGVAADYGGYCDTNNDALSPTLSINPENWYFVK
jgi:hypothetical protein